MTPTEQELDLQEIELARDTQLAWHIAECVLNNVAGMSLVDYMTMDEIKAIIVELKKQGEVK